MKKIMLVILIILAIFIAQSVSAANWYVDRNASGANNGTSWSNAWHNFASIAWNDISPGDVIYISGGATSKTYNETLTVQRSGSQGNNIVIQTGQDSGHNGRVIIDVQRNQQNCILLTDYVTISGRVGDQRNMLIRGSISAGIHSSDADGNVLTYLEVTDCGSAQAQGGFGHGIRLGGANNGCEVSYSYIHHNYQDGYNAGGSAGGAFGLTRIHHNRIEYNSDDGIACRSGHDIYENMIGDMWRQPGGGGGHPDGIQAQGTHTRIWNNTIYNCRTHGIFVDPLNAGSANHLYVYNNVVYRTQSFVNDGLHMTGIKVKQENGTTSMNDVLVANNTVVDVGYSCISIENSNNTSNVVVKNNICYNARSDGNHGYVMGTDDNAGDFDNNIIYSGDRGGSNMMWNGSNYSFSQFIANQYGQTHGSDDRPIFASYREFGGHSNDYHIDDSDTVARGNGANLSAYFTTDRDGNYRATWDIGAYTYGGSAPPQSTLDPPKNLRIMN